MQRDRFAAKAQAEAGAHHRQHRGLLINGCHDILAQSELIEKAMEKPIVDGGRRCSESMDSSARSAQSLSLIKISKLRWRDDAVCQRGEAQSMIEAAFLFLIGVQRGSVIVTEVAEKEADIQFVSFQPFRHLSAHAMAKFRFDARAIFHQCFQHETRAA